MKGAILNKRNLVIIFIISIAIIYILLPKNNSFNSPSESCDAKFTKTFKFIEVVKEEHIKDIGLFTAKSLNDDFFEGLIDFFDNFLSDAYRAGFQCNERRCEFSEIWEPEGAKYNVKASPKEGDDCTGSKEIDVTGKGTSTWSGGAQANAILNLKAKLKKASEGVCKSPCTAKLTGVGDVGYAITS